LCQDSDNIVTGGPIYGRYCVDLKVPRILYHNLSLSRSIGADNEFEFTFGVANLFDKRPPRVTIQEFQFGEITTFGPVAFASQYEFLGRRAFVNVSRRF
jgi:iron complex outermembrane receptor protein